MQHHKLRGGSVGIGSKVFCQAGLTMLVVVPQNQLVCQGCYLPLSLRLSAACLPERFNSDKAVHKR